MGCRISDRLHTLATVPEKDGEQGSGALPSMINGAVSVFLVDDDRCALKEIKEGLRTVFGVAIIGHASYLLGAILDIRKLKPDIVLVTAPAAMSTGAEAVRKLKGVFPAAAVILVAPAADDDEPEAFEWIRAGASGFCRAGVPIPRLIMAMQAVSMGVTWIDTAAPIDAVRPCDKLSGLPGLPHSINLPALSRREMEVLQLLAEGLTNQQIARTLSLSLETIKTHLRHIMEKLAVSDRTQAVAKALRTGLVS